MARQVPTIPKPPAPTKIEPDFARSRALQLWKGYHKVVEAIERSAAKRPLTASIRSGRVMRAGEGKERYQIKITGGEPKPLKPRTPPPSNPRSYMKAKVGAERYRNFINSKQGDPYP